jgi:hypothetical protein
MMIHGQTNTDQVIGELLMALHYAANQLSSGTESSHSGILAKLIKQGCQDYQQMANSPEKHYLLQFPLDCQKYWHDNQNGHDQTDNT